MFNGIFNQLTLELLRVRSDYIYEQFERHGYSREVIQKLNSGSFPNQRFYAEEQPGLGVTYSIDGKPLFRVSELKFTGAKETNDSYTFKVYWTCEDLQEPVVRGEKHESRSS